MALRMVKECAETIRDKVPGQGKTLSAIGGVESGNHAAEFILLGGDSVQVCTGVMKLGYDMVKRMKDELLSFMAKHKFEKIEDFKGHSLQYFTTHADLVKRQTDSRAVKKAEHDRKKVVQSDEEWKGDDFVRQTEALARG